MVELNRIVVSSKKVELSICRDVLFDAVRAAGNIVGFYVVATRSEERKSDTVKLLPRHSATCS